MNNRNELLKELEEGILDLMRGSPRDDKVRSLVIDCRKLVSLIKFNFVNDAEYLRELYIKLDELSVLVECWKRVEGFKEYIRDCQRIITCLHFDGAITALKKQMYEEQKYVESDLESNSIVLLSNANKQLEAENEELKTTIKTLVKLFEED